MKSVNRHILFCLLLAFQANFLSSQKDSLIKNNLSKITLCINGGVTQFNYYESVFTQNISSRGLLGGNYSKFDGKVLCPNYVNPQLILDIMLKGNFKATLGFDYSEINFSTPKLKHDYYEVTHYRRGPYYSARIDSSVSNLVKSEMVRDDIKIRTRGFLLGLGYSKKFGN